MRRPARRPAMLKCAKCGLQGELMDDDATGDLMPCNGCARLSCTEHLGVNCAACYVCDPLTAEFSSRVMAMEAAGLDPVWLARMACEWPSKPKATKTRPKSVKGF